MESVFHMIFLLFISINSNVFGLGTGLTFFGQYVVFRPKTQFVKFDLLEEVDIVLLEYRPNKPNIKLQDTDYLYRIHLIVDNSVPEEVRVNCTIQRRGGHIMVKGQYKFWNETEMWNMAMSWRSEKTRIIEVLTQFGGNHNVIFSWTDRSITFPPVRYIGLAVAPASPEPNYDNSNHRHLSWKIREADPADVDIRNAYNMCSVKLLSGDPRNRSSNVTTFYQISITREADENFFVSLRKRNNEVLRATTYRMDCEKLSISLNANEKTVHFGLKGDSAPIFVWRDSEENGYDYNNIKYIAICRLSAGRKNETTSTTVVQVTKVQPMEATTESIFPYFHLPVYNFGSSYYSD